MKSTQKKIVQWFVNLRRRYVITWLALIVLLITVVYPAWMGWARYVKSMGPQHSLSTFSYQDYRKIETDRTTFVEVTTFFGEPRVLNEDVAVRVRQDESAGDKYVGPLTLHRWQDRHARVEIRVDERGVVRWMEYTWFGD